MKKIIGIFVMMLLIGTTIPVIGTINGNEFLFIKGSDNLYKTGQKHFTSINSQSSVLWDNGLRYSSGGAYQSQWDPIDNMGFEGADDFQFETNTEITGVNWIGGYFNPGEDADYNWNVSFYMDRGDGTQPGDKIFEQVFTNDMVHETFIEVIWDDFWMASYSVDLVDPLNFEGGNKYWISIQGVGDTPPMTGWACHFGISLNDLVLRILQGSRRWMSSTELGYGNLLDFCFQLTGEGEPVVPDLDCEYDIIIDDVPPGMIVNVTFTVINEGDVGSFLGWEVLSYPDWGSNWLSQWFYDDWLILNDSGFVGSANSEDIILQVQVPDEKNQEFSGNLVLVNIDDPEDTCTINIVCKTPRIKNIFQSFIERFIERFPILEILI